MREILNGIFYVLRSGCAWRLLPHEFPPWSTVYHYFRSWRNAGSWEQMHMALRERLRRMVGRHATSSAAIIDDSQLGRASRLRRRQKAQWPETASAGQYHRPIPQSRGLCRR